MTELVLKPELLQRHLTAFEDESDKAGEVQGTAKLNEVRVKCAIVAKWFEGNPEIQDINLGNMTGAKIAELSTQIMSKYVEALDVDPNS